MIGITGRFEPPRLSRTAQPKVTHSIPRGRGVTDSTSSTAEQHRPGGRQENQATDQVGWPNNRTSTQQPRSPHPHPTPTLPYRHQNLTKTPCAKNCTMATMHLSVHQRNKGVRGPEGYPPSAECRLVCRLGSSSPSAAAAAAASNSTAVPKPGATSPTTLT